MRNIPRRTAWSTTGHAPASRLTLATASPTRMVAGSNSGVVRSPCPTISNASRALAPEGK